MLREAKKKKKMKRIRGTRDLYFDRTGRKRGVKPLAPVCKNEVKEGRLSSRTSSNHAATTLLP